MRFLGTCACDRIIIDKAGAHSLISIMSNADIAITPPEGTSLPLPQNAVVPREWWVFSLWEPHADDVGKEFEQAVEVYWPNGEKLTEMKIKFKPDEKVQYNSCQILGFPLGQQGKVRIVTWVERQGGRITDPFEYFVTVRHLTPAQEPLAGMPHGIGVYSIPKQ